MRIRRALSATDLDGSLWNYPVFHGVAVPLTRRSDVIGKQQKLISLDHYIYYHCCKDMCRID